MYDLQMFTMRDMSECGLALRSLGKKANSVWRKLVIILSNIFITI